MSIASCFLAGRIGTAHERLTDRISPVPVGLRPSGPLREPALQKLPNPSEHEDDEQGRGRRDEQEPQQQASRRAPSRSGVGRVGNRRAVDFGRLVSQRHTEGAGDQRHKRYGDDKCENTGDHGP